MKLLAMCGLKQSGKNTSANYLVGRMLVAIGMVRTGFTITEKGELYVNDIDGEVYEDLILTGIDGKILTFRDQHQLSDRDFLVVTTTDNQQIDIQINKTKTPFIIELFNDFGLDINSIKSICKKKIKNSINIYICIHNLIVLVI